MVYTQSRRAFKFGDGKIVHSIKRVKVPAKIGQTRCNIETEVVPVDIPLLLSKTSLKRAKAVLDIENDKATIFQKPITLEITSSAHNCVSIIDRDCTTTRENEPQADEVLAIPDGMSTWIGHYMKQGQRLLRSGELCSHSFAPQRNSTKLEIKCTTKEWTAMNGKALGW